jgi:SAM-dependent methyltransferase
VNVEERHDGILSVNSPWHGEHLARYRHAIEAGVTGRILDIACGSGYGSAFLGAHGSQVVAVDIDHGAASRGLLATSASQASGEDLPFRSECFDSVVSIETLEHVANPARFLDELRRVLRPGGLLVLSTPNARYTKPVEGTPTNPYHLREYFADELVDLVGDRFADTKVLGQDLGRHVRVSPFQVDQQGQRAGWMRTKVLVWRVLNKLPPSFHDFVSRRLWGHTLHLRETDYVFSPDLAQDGRVLVLHGRRP